MCEQCFFVCSLVLLCFRRLRDSLAEHMTSSSSRRTMTSLVILLLLAVCCNSQTSTQTGIDVDGGEYRVLGTSWVRGTIHLPLHADPVHNSLLRFCPQTAALHVTRKESFTASIVLDFLPYLPTWHLAKVQQINYARNTLIYFNYQSQ